MLQALNNYAFFFGALLALILAFVGFVALLNIRMGQLTAAQNKHWLSFVENLKAYIYHLIDQRFREIEQQRDQDL